MTLPSRVLIILAALTLATPLLSPCVSLAQRCGPAEIGWIGGEPADVVVENAIAYVAHEEGGVRVLDLSDPTAPRAIASIDLPHAGRAARVALDGDTLFVAAQKLLFGIDSLTAIDVSTPASPRILGSLPSANLRGHLFDMQASDGRLFLLGSCIRMFDVRNPAQIREIDRFPQFSADGSTSHDLAISGTSLFTPLGDGRVGRIDLADPSTSIPLAPFGSMKEDTTRTSVPSADVENDHLYVIDGDGVLTIRDLSSNTPGEAVGTLAGLNAARALDAAGDHVLILTGRTGTSAIPHTLTIVDVSKPTEPRLARVVDLPAPATELAADAARACVITYEHYGAMRVRSLVTIDLAADDDRALAAYDEPDRVTRIARIGDLLLAIEPAHGLRIIDASSPASPAILGAWRADHYAHDVAARGEYAWVVTEHALVTLSIADPTAPSEVATTPLRYLRLGPASISLGKDFLLVGGDAGSGVDVFDLADPASPRHAGDLPLAVGSHRAVIRDRLAFLPINVSGMNNLLVVDIADHASPDVIASLQTPGRPVSLALGPDFLAIATLDAAGSSNGLRIVDITNPTSPRLGAFLPLNGLLTGVHVDGDRAVVVASNRSRATIIDLSDPRRPRRIADAAVNAFPEGVLLDEDLAAIAGGTGGLRILDLGPFARGRTADLNADARVDAEDLTMLLAAWRGADTEQADATPDLNSDARVDAADLALLLGAWGDCR